MKIAVALKYNDRLYNTTIEQGQEISIGTHKKDNVQVPGFLTRQMVIKWKKNGISVNSKKPFVYENNSVPLDTLIFLDESGDTLIFFSTVSGKSEQTVKLPYNCKLKVGRNAHNDISISLGFVSGEHFILKNESGMVRIEDSNSTHGIYLNGVRTKISKMKSGDILSILTVQILLQNGELFFFNTGKHLLINEIKEENENTQIKFEKDVSFIKYHRSPRMQDMLPYEDIVLAAAPNKGHKFEKHRGMFSSLAGSGAMFAANMLTSVTSPALMAARAASLVSPLSSVASSSNNSKRRKKQFEEYEMLRREKYGAYIEDQKARILSVAEVQKAILTKENPSPKECIKSLFELNRSLWERMFSDRDFLDVRIGMGYEDLCVKVKSRAENGSFQMEDDDIRELTEQIIEETRIIDNVPSRLKLLKYKTVGVIGDRKKIIHLVKNLIVSLTTTHSYDDVKIVGMFDKSEYQQWKSLRWLPHIWDENQKTRFLAFNSDDADSVCETLNQIATERKEKSLYDGGTKFKVPNPYYVFFIGSKNLIETSAIMGKLASNDPALGMSAVFLYDDLYQLPNGCQLIVDMNNGPSAFERGEANKKFYFTLDPEIDAGWFDAFSRRMSAIKLDEGYEMSALPSSISFMEGYGVRKKENLHIIERWNASKPYETLAAPIGKLVGDEDFCLDVHEKVHGPHGLVAGTTGSGKSEILLTWILSMAVNYHPHDVNFVLIDYKGGNMAGSVRALPHVVGEITNIGSDIKRNLLSLSSELKKRQAIFSEKDVKDIYKYQKLYKQGKVSEPLAHLIIVADEFAELKKEEPEFMSELISVSRIGRSLGVHLILATQKPAGVVDEQILGNSRFRLCLKVQDVTDSREMIKRPDAAKIIQAGRSFVRIGEDEYFNLIQSYWSGAEYLGDISEEELVGNPVRIVEINGKRVNPVKTIKKSTAENSEQLDVLVQYINKVAQDNGIEKLNGPWLPELPEALTLDTVLGDMENSGSWLKFPIGIYDYPAKQKQGIQYISLLENSCYGIYGAPRTGKTTILKTIVMSAARTHRPDEVNFYILDCGGWSLNMLSALPHVGGVVLDCEDEKIKKFSNLILEEFEIRKQLFYKKQVSSLQSYRELVSDDLPAIVIVVDNLVALCNLYPDMEDVLIKVAREGSSYGLHLIFTANSSATAKYRIVQNVQGAIAFELTDKSEYTNLVGRTEGQSLFKITGRGFAKGNPPMLFQGALFAEGNDEKECVVNATNTISEISGKWNGYKAKKIPVMPETVTVEMMEGAFTNRMKVPLGIETEHIAECIYDFRLRNTLLLTGSIGCGKSLRLAKIAGLIKKKYETTRLFVFDGVKKSLSALKDSSEAYVCFDNDRFGEAVASLRQIIRTRHQEWKAYKESTGQDVSLWDFTSEKELVCVVIDDWKEMMTKLSATDCDALEEICRNLDKMGAIILVAERYADVAQYMHNETFTRYLLENKRYLALNVSPAQVNFFAISLKQKERDTVVSEGCAYMFHDGVCEIIKLME
ncbi:MAG: type VII secretion protein EssC [Lachnospiraceae bacterium]